MAGQDHTSFEHPDPNRLGLYIHEPVGHSHCSLSRRAIYLEYRRLTYRRYNGPQKADGERQPRIAPLAVSADLKVIYGHSAPGPQGYDGAICHPHLQPAACRYVHSVTDIYRITNSERSPLPAGLGEALATEFNDGTHLLCRPCGSD